MYVFFSVLSLFSFLSMIVGLIKPSIFNKIFKNKINRKKILIIFGGATIALLIVSGLTTPESVKEQNKIDTQKRAEQIIEKKRVSEQVMQEADQQKINQENTQKEIIKEEENQQPVPEVVKTLEEKVSDVINASLGAKTNMEKQRVVSVEVNKYSTSELSMYEYKNNEPIVSLLIKINSSENLTTNLQKATIDKEATEIAKVVFPLDKNIGDIIIWSQLPLKDKYGNVSDSTAIAFSISRTLFDKINWNNFNYHNLPTLLNSEGMIDDRNSYFEKIKF